MKYGQERRDCLVFLVPTRRKKIVHRNADGDHWKATTMAAGNAGGYFGAAQLDFSV